MSDYSDSSRRSLEGLKKDGVDGRDFKFGALVKEVLPTLPTLPSELDLSAGMSSVKDQGALGSCVGFAAAAVKEYQEELEHTKEVLEGKKYVRREEEYDLSEAWVYWNAKKIDGWPGEEGTDLRSACRVLQRIGVPCERAYPYSDRFRGSPASWAKLIAKWGLVDSYWRVDGVDQIRQALFTTGPLIVGIACFEEIFEVGADGVVPYPSRPDRDIGGHALPICGYSDAVRLVKFKNSWGRSWGDKGYGYLSYDYIRDFLWDAWVIKDLKVTRKTLQDRGKDDLI